MRNTFAGSVIRGKGKNIGLLDILCWFGWFLEGKKWVKMQKRDKILGLFDKK
jgi:hypothetical protein